MAGWISTREPHDRTLVTGAATSADGYGRATAVRAEERAISSWLPTHTGRSSRTASATGAG
ncbi:hypothetical protein ACQEV2_41020 [Streptomyces sp. CA-251387]|uniref:hypothetical protein n=1 Tax=Streptomyces sp. CA-251387 TaxID=3240064 RepID=UPI003D8C5E2E